MSLLCVRSINNIKQSLLPRPRSGIERAKMSDIPTRRQMTGWHLWQESLAKLKKDLFLPSQRCLTPCRWGTTCNINAIYTSLKSTFSGLQFRCWQFGSIFIRLAVIASETRQMSQNSQRIWPYNSSRSSKSSIVVSMESPCVTFYWSL